MKRKNVEYSPWLIQNWSGWSDKKNTWLCVRELKRWFNLPSREVCDDCTIRVRISNISLGDDYQVTGDRSGDWWQIESSKGNEIVLMFASLSDKLYVGCWIGLEIRKRES